MDKNHIYLGRFFYYRFPIWCGKIHCDASSQVKFLIRASSHTYRFVGNRADRAKMIVTLAHWYTRSKLGYTRVIYIHCTLLQTGDEFLSWVYHTLVNIAIFHNSVQLCEFYFVLLYLYVKCEPRNVNKQDFNNAVFPQLNQIWFLSVLFVLPLRYS